MANRRIEAKQLLADIRSGLDDAAIRKKYDLSSKGLRTLFEKLVDSRVLTHNELYERSPLYKDTVDLTKARLFSRQEIVVPLPISVYQAPGQGLVRDISESGLRVAGIDAEVGEVKRFVLTLDLLTDTKRIVFDATCKWAKAKGKTNKYTDSGYEITNIPEEAKESLRKFIRLSFLSASAEWRTIT